MSTLGERKLSELVQAVVYSPPKVGKTFGAGTFPRPNFIDFDKGIATLASPDFIRQHGWHPEIQFEDFKEKSVNNRGVPLMHNAYDDACRYFDKCMLKANVDSFDTWVIDTGTFLAEAAMTKALILLGKEKGFKGISSNTQMIAEQYGLIVPKLQDYGSERSLTEQFVEMIKESGKHCLFLCHERENFDDDGKLVSITPLLTGKSVQVINAMFDEVWRLETKKVVEGGKAVVKRVLRTETDGIRMAGSRLGIPTGTEWNWAAVSSALEANAAERSALQSTPKE